MTCYFKVIFPLNIKDGFVYEYDSEIKRGVRVEVDLRGEKKTGIVWEKVENPLFETKKIKKIIDEEPLIEEGLMKSIQFTSSYYNAPLGMVIKSAFPKKLFQKISIDVEENTEIVWGEKAALSKEQEEAYREVSPYIKGAISQPFLLFGAAGSGKTELCLRLVEYALKNGGSVLVLVPEIFLTPQLVKLFTERFGKKVVAVTHSRLTPKERFDVWCRVRTGAIKVLVGTRSAVFMPLKNIKFIVVDNEQDESYKQEAVPLYNAKDVAVVRAKDSHIPIMLVSATPSLESLYKAKNGEYKLIEFKGRSQNVPLPQMNIVSLKGGGLITSAAKREIRNTLRSKKSVIVLVNRRGFNSFIICKECGYIFTCSKCSVSLTYYKDDHIFKCHFCGATYSLPNMCPRCGGFQLISCGMGTERVQKTLKGLFPQAHIVRVDRDTMRKKKDFQRVLKEIEEKTADIIVGTQMVSKGHNYPHINLAVVASFEALLSSPDVRATEKAVSLIIQVAGRAGREMPGKVIIQSLNPDNPLFKYVKKYDWRTFAEEELKSRKDLLYPPFTHLIRFVFRGREEKKLREQAQKFVALLKEKIKREIIYGPVKAPIYMIKNEYRYHILIKTNDVKNTLKRINESQKKIQYNIRTICDVDPMNFL